MTKKEFVKISWLIGNGWPGQFDEDNVAAYAEFLIDFDFEAVRMALHKLTRDGQKFVPSVGLIAAAVKELTEPQVPSWSETWAMIEKAMKAHPTVKVELEPVVEAFINVEGLRRLQMTPFYDPEKGSMLIHQLAKRFEEFSDVWQARESRSKVLEAAGVAEIGPGGAPAYTLGLKR